MALRLYDTKTAEIRDFEPLEAGRVNLYYCGATVQGAPHVGHVRSAVAFDILARWLEASGYAVQSVRNITDIDDKILEKSAASFGPEDQLGEDAIAQEPWYALAYRFEQAFHAAYDALGVRRPTYEPRATGHITEMLTLIGRLIEGGHAYPALDDSGDVYFDVRSWKQYGELTHQRVEDMQDAPDADPRGKRDPRDFALWKAYKPGEPQTAAWSSPWGAGRPGWHLECSAMATKYLGAEFDIHGGGLDLRFPHHENELAQSAAAGDGFARYWLHNGMVVLEGEKMSKSLGNTVSPASMMEQVSPRAVRYFLGQAQYRSPLVYTAGSLQEAAAAVKRIDTFLERVPVPEEPSQAALAESLPEAFRAAMNDDLNVPAALAVLHESVRSGNTAYDDGETDRAQKMAASVKGMVTVLGLSDVPVSDAASSQTHRALSALVEELLGQRAQAKAAREYAQADAIRDRLTAAGIQIEDTTSGPVWSLVERKAD